MRWSALFIAAFLFAPATASAQRVEDTFFNSVISSRVDHLIGFTPTTFAIHPRGQRVVPIKVRVGGRRYRYIFGNAAAVVGPVNIYVRNMIRARRFPSPQGIFLDRRLTAAERRHVQVRADLARDADVLAVGRGHPACASGVSRAVARAIAAGTIRTWSAAGVPTPVSGDAIALRRAGSGVDRFVEPRFRAGIRLPKGARAAPDGGLSEAASGKLAIAAVTSWSRALAYQGTTCGVPVGGAAPSDASVRALSHPDAYPISFVTLRRLRDVRPIVAAFLQYLTGPRAATSLRERGMLLVRMCGRRCPVRTTIRSALDASAPAGGVLVILLAAPATAGAVPVLRVTEHFVPAAASTGEVVQARVTVTNVGDTPTEASTEVGWEATNDEGFIIADFVRRPAVCPPGAEDVGPGPATACHISAPIRSGASVTAVFSGASRRAAVLEARASVVDWGTGLSDHDTKRLMITGPTLPEPPGPRISRLTIEDRRVRPGELARLRFTLDRTAKVLHGSLWRCLGRTGCRRAQLVLNSTITRRGRRGPNTLPYPLPARLAPGRYRVTVSAYEPFRRQLPRSVTFQVLPRRR